MNPLKSMASFGASVFRALGYDAAQNGTQRKRMAGTLMHEDDQLTPTERRVLLDSTRTAQRNFSVAAWGVRKHLDFVASHCFTARTPDRGFNAELEAAVAQWSKAEACDFSGRHPLRRMIRMGEARRTVDGDMGFLKRQSGHLQAIEGDRVRQPTAQLIQFGNAGDWRHGVHTDDGRAVGYAVHKRIARGGFEFEREVPADAMLWFATYEANHRFDATRGVSPMAAGLNQMRDAFEGIGYALAKAKVAQLFGLKITREGNESAAPLDSKENTDADGNTKTKHTIDFGNGPVFLDLDPGEDAGFMENKTPPMEFQAFMQSVLAIALKSLDLPFSFFDEAYTNFFGSRAALLLYLQSANHKRADVQDLLNAWFWWRFNYAFSMGEISPPRSLADGFNVAFVPDGLPWWRPSEEITADIKAIAAGVKTRNDVTLAHFGRTFEETGQLLEAEEDAIRGLNINITEAPALGTNAAATGPAENGADIDQDTLAAAIAERVSTLIG